MFNKNSTKKIFNAMHEMNTINSVFVDDFKKISMLPHAEAVLDLVTSFRAIRAVSSVGIPDDCTGDESGTFTS